MGMLPNPDDVYDNAFGTDSIFYWELNNLPTEVLENLDKVYFATRKYIIGYFRVCDVDMDNNFEFRANSWTLLKEPIPTKSFQGFKYADKVSELNSQTSGSKAQ